MIACTILIALAVLAPTVNAEFVVIEKAIFENRPDFIQQVTRVSPEELLEVVFAVKQRNLDVVEDILKKVSDPFGTAYGKFLKKQGHDFVNCL
jgi:hypothetical protein